MNISPSRRCKKKIITCHSRRYATHLTNKGRVRGICQTPPNQQEKDKQPTENSAKRHVLHKKELTQKANKHVRIIKNQQRQNKPQ